MTEPTPTETRADLGYDRICTDPYCPTCTALPCHCSDAERANGVAATYCPRDGETPPPGFKACGCGVLLGESCDCGEFAASATAALASPLALVYEKGTYRWER